MKELEDYCSRNYGLRYGELSRAFDAFLRAADEYIASGYCIDMPIGSFAPKLNEWTQGENPKLLVTKQGMEFIYTVV